MAGVNEYQCGENTARDTQCLHRAKHLVDGNRFMCQQHWECYMEEQGYRLS